MPSRRSPAKLIHAVEKKQYTIVRRLLRAEMYDPNVPHDETTALHIAAAALDVELAALLIHWGADPDLSAVPGGPTAYDVALSMQSTTAVEGSARNVASLVMGTSEEKLNSLAQESKTVNRGVLLLRLFDDGAKSMEGAKIVEALDRQLDVLEAAERSSSTRSAYAQLFMFLALTVLYFSGVATSRLEKAGDGDSREL